MIHIASIDFTTASYLEYMIHGFMNGLITLQEIDGLTDEELETIYALGYNYFTFGKYQAARDIFMELTAYAPYIAHYWRALGATNQQLGDYDEALTAYDMAIANDEGDIVSYIYRGETKMLNGQIAEGLKALEDAIEVGKDYPEFVAWVNRAQLLLGIHKKYE